LPRRYKAVSLALEKFDDNPDPFGDGSGPREAE
jgi:hypothetical protein